MATQTGGIDLKSMKKAHDQAYSAASSAQTSADAAQASADAAQVSADEAEGHAQTALTNAGLAQTAANDAQASADNASEYAARALGNLSTVQSVTETLTWITQHGTMTLTSDTTPDPTHVYFVVDPAGDYTVGSTKYSVVTEPVTADMNTYYELSIDESLNNYVGTHVALTSEGLWLIPEAGGNKVLIATGGTGHTYEDAGTYIIDENDNISAQFLEDGATIYGPSNALIAHLGYGPGTSSGGGTSDAPYYTLGKRDDGGTIGNYSVAEGHDTVASGYVAHAEGAATAATGHYSHAEGTNTLASGGMSHAEGGWTTANGVGSHAEGAHTEASGGYSHSEGRHTEASGWCAHAEGGNYAVQSSETTLASGDHSHAEGYLTTASGEASHSQNYKTIASSNNQTALGKLNVVDANNEFAVIVGNGTVTVDADDNVVFNRSNALTVDWDGRIECGDYSGNLKSIFDLFYPVGSYYETSLPSAIPSGSSTPTAADLATLGSTWFNPKYAWGGEWSLESAGKFHVSAGTNYSVGATGGSANAIIPYHRHNVAAITEKITGGEHDHGSGTFATNSKGSHSHEPYNTDYQFMACEGTSSAALGRYQIKQGTGSSTTHYFVSSATAVGRYNATESAGAHTHDVTGTSGKRTHKHDLPQHYTDYVGTSGNTTGANMPPYIAVNRWHRTA